MTATPTTHPAASPTAAPPLRTTPLVLAALASAGAGLVHAAAAGSHNGDRTLALLFAGAAVSQLGWAALALARPARVVAAAGVALNLSMVVVWALTRTDAGVPGLAILGSGETTGLQDASAAGLAAAAVVAATWSWCAPTAPEWMRSRVLAPLAVLAVAAVAVPAMAAEHSHEHGGEAAPEVAAESPDTSTVAFVEPLDEETDPADASEEIADGHDHDHGPGGPVVSLYDPRLTPEQRQAARALIDDTRAGMERFRNLDDVIAEGYISIGDGITGYEHWIHIGYIADGIELDPNRIESIVTQNHPDGTKEIVSAMYLMSPGSTMDDVPDIAGPLTIWHDHQDLCWEGARVVGRIQADGSCVRGQFRGTAPMLHVWLVPHPCGPFAGLEGHGGRCDHDH
jgi:hypothetical protein